MTRKELLDKIESLELTYSINEFNDNQSYEDRIEQNNLKEKIKSLKEQLKSFKEPFYYVTDGRWYIGSNPSLCFSTDIVYYDTKEDAEKSLKNAIMDESNRKNFHIEKVNL